MCPTGRRKSKTAVENAPAEAYCPSSLIHPRRNTVKLKALAFIAAAAFAAGAQAQQAARPRP